MAPPAPPPVSVPARSPLVIVPIARIDQPHAGRIAFAQLHRARRAGGAHHQRRGGRGRTAASAGRSGRWRGARDRRVAVPRPHRTPPGATWTLCSGRIRDRRLLVVLSEVRAAPLVGQLPAQPDRATAQAAALLPAEHDRGGRALPRPGGVAHGCRFPATDVAPRPSPRHVRAGRAGEPAGIDQAIRAVRAADRGPGAPRAHRAPRTAAGRSLRQGHRAVRRAVPPSRQRSSDRVGAGPAPRGMAGRTATGAARPGGAAHPHRARGPRAHRARSRAWPSSPPTTSRRRPTRPRRSCASWSWPAPGRWR